MSEKVERNAQTGPVMTRSRFRHGILPGLGFLGERRHGGLLEHGYQAHEGYIGIGGLHAVKSTDALGLGPLEQMHDAPDLS